MNIDNNSVVSLTYELKENDKEGKMIQVVEDADPFYFLFGHKNVIAGFETHLKGKTVGDEFDFSVPSDEAYGPINEEAVVAVDRNNLNFPTKEQEDEMLQIGRTLPMQDQEGNPLNGMIQEITEEYVRMDFNHPLAGVNLHFSGKVLEVREASQEEIEHGHVHGPGGHQH